MHVTLNLPGDFLNLNHRSIFLYQEKTLIKCELEHLKIRVGRLL